MKRCQIIPKNETVVKKNEINGHNIYAHVNLTLGSPQLHRERERLVMDTKIVHIKIDIMCQYHVHIYLPSSDRKDASFWPGIVH